MSSVNSALQPAKKAIVDTTSDFANGLSSYGQDEDTRTDVSYTGPVGTTIQNEVVETKNQFSEFAANAQEDARKNATDRGESNPYHSMFYRLLSWRDKRVTAAAWATVVILIFTSRYFNASRYSFSGLCYAFGFTAAAEILGQATTGKGFMTAIRPKKYFEVPKDSLARFVKDLSQLINFFVREFQRILFVENVWVTVTAFTACFISYYAIHWLPLWGFWLLATVPVFGVPLAYTTNREFFDQHIEHAQQVIIDQQKQVRDLASQHLSKGGETVQNYAEDLSSKAHNLAEDLSSKASKLLGDAKLKVASTRGSISNTTPSPTGVRQPSTSFPSAPIIEPVSAKPVAVKQQPVAEP